jgi:plasmid stabilization system protein ParE
MSGPHDLFARFTFSHPERAAAELRAVLPSDVAAQVDWASLRSESTSVVDPELRERQSDLLFSARLHEGLPVLLYFLIEHQSSVDRWMSFRMLRYVVRLLEHWRQQHPSSEKLPVIIPIVMHHGSEGGWTAPRRVEELFHLPSGAAERWWTLVPRFEHLVDDLTAEGWQPLFAELVATPEGEQHLRAIVHYLLRAGVEAAHEALRRMLHSVTSEQRTEELMRTMADALIEKGLVQGMAKGRAEAVLRLLRVRGIAVDESTRQLILTCTNVETLDRWIDRAVHATSLSDLGLNA